MSETCAYSEPAQVTYSRLPNLVGGIVTGPIYDRGYVRELLLSGTVLTVLGVMMLSLATEFYQVLLAQGICVGIGSAILYVPSISLVASGFHKHRALAVFVATSGTAFGTVWSVSTQSEPLLNARRRHYLSHYVFSAAAQDWVCVDNPHNRICNPR